MKQSGIARFMSATGAVKGGRSESRWLILPGKKKSGWSRLRNSREQGLGVLFPWLPLGRKGRR